MKQEILNCKLSLTLTHYNEFPEIEIHHNGQSLDIDFKNKSSNNLLTALTKHFLITDHFDKEFELMPSIGKQKIELIFKNSHLKNKTLAIQTSLAVNKLSINNFELSTKNILLRNSKFYSNNKKIEKNIKEFPLFLRTDGNFIFEFETPFVTWAIRQF